MRPSPQRLLAAVLRVSFPVDNVLALVARPSGVFADALRGHEAVFGSLDGGLVAAAPLAAPSVFELGACPGESLAGVVEPLAAVAEDGLRLGEGGAAVRREAAEDLVEIPVEGVAGPEEPVDAVGEGVARADGVQDDAGPVVVEGVVDGGDALDAPQVSAVPGGAGGDGGIEPVHGGLGGVDGSFGAVEAEVGVGDGLVGAGDGVATGAVEAAERAEVGAFVLAAVEALERPSVFVAGASEDPAGFVELVGAIRGAGVEDRRVPVAFGAELAVEVADAAVGELVGVDEDSVAGRVHPGLGAPAGSGEGGPAEFAVGRCGWRGCDRRCRRAPGVRGRGRRRRRAESGGRRRRTTAARRGPREGVEWDGGVAAGELGDLVDHQYGPDGEFVAAGEPLAEVGDGLGLDPRGAQIADRLVGRRGDDDRSAGVAGGGDGGVQGGGLAVPMRSSTTSPGSRPTPLASPVHRPRSRCGVGVRSLSGSRWRTRGSMRTQTRRSCVTGVSRCRGGQPAGAPATL